MLTRRWSPLGFHSTDGSPAEQRVGREPGCLRWSGWPGGWSESLWLLHPGERKKIKKNNNNHDQKILSPLEWKWLRWHRWSVSKLWSENWRNGSKPDFPAAGLVKCDVFAKSVSDLKHERVGRVHKDGAVLLGGRLQTELRIGGLGVVGQRHGARQLAVVQHLLVMLGEVDVALGLELERALGKKGKQTRVKLKYRERRRRMEASALFMMTCWRSRLRMTQFTQKTFSG